MGGLTYQYDHVDLRPPSLGEHEGDEGGVQLWEGLLLGGWVGGWVLLSLFCSFVFLIDPHPISQRIQTFSSTTHPPTHLPPDRRIFPRRRKHLGLFV